MSDVCLSNDPESPQTSVSSLMPTVPVENSSYPEILPTKMWTIVIPLLKKKQYYLIFSRLLMNETLVHSTRIHYRLCLLEVKYQAHGLRIKTVLVTKVLDGSFLSKCQLAPSVESIPGHYDEISLQQHLFFFSFHSLRVHCNNVYPFSRSTGDLSGGSKCAWSLHSAHQWTKKSGLLLKYLRYGTANFSSPL